MEQGAVSVPPRKFGAAIHEKMELFGGGHISPPRMRIGDQFAVMLHLRSRYVSKAAILTTPALSVPVENRSPA